MSNAKSNANRNPIRTLRSKAGLALLLACMAVMAAAGAKYFPPGPNAPASASTAYPPGPTAPVAAVASFPPGLGVVGPEI